jgi:predicted Fe-S protein YdhL (DUF1289 family)
MREIASWSTLPADQRRTVMAELAGRKAAILDREKRARGYRLPGS